MRYPPHLPSFFLRFMKRRTGMQVLSAFFIIFLSSAFSISGNFFATSKVSALNENTSTILQASWWNNATCDSAFNPGSGSHASYRGVQECDGGKGYSTTFGGQSRYSIQEWQCIELVFRYLWTVYHIPVYAANGKDVVNNFPSGGWPNENFQKFTNNTSQAQHNPPEPGDIVSYYNPSNSSDAGHVALVTYANVDPGTGNGYITVLQQNAGTDYTKNETVSAWVVQDLYTGRRPENWLHDPTSTSPSVVRNRNNELEVFARDKDGFMEHAWQTNPGGGWSGWSILGGGTMIRFLGDPAVANNAGLLQIFAIGMDHNLYSAWQNSNGGWTNWVQFTGGTILIGDPVVYGNRDGRMELFVRQDNGTLWDTSKQCPGNCGWYNWSPMTNGTGYTVADDPAVGMNNDGRLELFIRDNSPSQDILHIAQEYAGGPWGNISSIGGYAVGRQSVARNYQGELEVFARGSDSTIWHNWQNAPGGGQSGANPGTNWSGWQGMGGGYGNNPTVAVNANGAMEVILRGSDQHIYHNYQLNPGGGWSGWNALAGAPYNFWGDVTIWPNADGRLEAFMKGETDYMYHDWQNSVNGSNNWSPFTGSDSISTNQFR